MDLTKGNSCGVATGALTPIPKRGGQGWPPVVVGCVHQTGLNLMRNFVRKGVRAVGIDYVRDHEGFRSIYGESRVCPNPDEDPGGWLDFMRALARSLNARPVFISAADVFVSALGRHAADLREAFIFSETAKLHADLCTKERQYALAELHGFPCPRTAYIRNEADLGAFTAVARFPCVLKPRHQREWEALPQGNPLRGLKLISAQTAEQLADHYRHTLPHQPDAIVQEFIPGPDDAKYCYLSVYASDGSRIGSSVVREFRAFPVSFGSASVVAPVVDDEIEDLCDRFLRSLRYTGICEIEVKRDARDRSVKLIEVNPRFSGTGDAAIYAGVDVGWLHYLDLLGYKLPPVKATRLNFRHITFRRDFPAIPPSLAAGLVTWGGLFRSYRPPLEFYDFDLRDWRVTASTMKAACRALVGGTLRAWKARA